MDWQTLQGVSGFELRWGLQFRARQWGARVKCFNVVRGKGTKIIKKQNKSLESLVTSTKLISTSVEQRFRRHIWMEKDPWKNTKWRQHGKGVAKKKAFYQSIKNMNHNDVCFSCFICSWCPVFLVVGCAFVFPSLWLHRFILPVSFSPVYVNPASVLCLCCPRVQALPCSLFDCLLYAPGSCYSHSCGCKMHFPVFSLPVPVWYGCDSSLDSWIITHTRHINLQPSHTLGFHPLITRMLFNPQW